MGNIKYPSRATCQGIFGLNEDTIHLDKIRAQVGGVPGNDLVVSE